MASMRMIIVLALAALSVHARHHHGHGHQQEPEVIEVIEVDEVDEIIIFESGNGTFEGSGFGSGNGSGIEGSGNGSATASGSGSGSGDESGSGSGSGSGSAPVWFDGTQTEDDSPFFRALNDTEESNCTALAKCTSDAECGSGKCIGAFVGTCECSKCLNFIFCKDDDACGGLQGACQNTTSTCSCLKGYQQAGFKTQFQANQEFCNKKTCTVDSADKDCFGFPCHTGICSCA
ncbi:unnamed protein product [Bursaphelenchus xylophilus]|uniref:(pine wood nematode) hypothetical protein n=1 Tax=Bursaphelenchus xylophilus TaxID=6326 RepID=A0A7I8WV70_BURXY|nr:unnamed protein product [Bursaphelenchus xylophilus]CAG9117427.1 unnamed protein product [Bursaphelenchus xylophilus]